MLFGVYAQTKTTTLPDPNKSLLLALALPGAGQVYNKQVWKLPIVLGTFLLTGYNAINQHNLYKNTRIAFLRATDPDPETINPFGDFSGDILGTATDRYRRNRDLMFILIGVFYALQAVEANTSAHLLAFDVSEDISMTIHPQWQTHRTNKDLNFALNLIVKLKK